MQEYLAMSQKLDYISLDSVDQNWLKAPIEHND
jgi:hypothetical protein